MNKQGILIYNMVSELFFEKLSKIQSNTNVNCLINFKKIEANLFSNCGISIINKCTSNTNTTFALFIESIKEILQSLDDEKRKIMENELEIKTNELDPNTDKGFIKTCKAYASFIKTIDVDLLKVDNCYSSIPIYFEFINNGEATSNCGMSELSRSLSHLPNNSSIYENYYLFKFLNITMENYIITILLLLVFTIILVIIIILIEKHIKIVTIIFYSRNDFFPK